MSQDLPDTDLRNIIGTRAREARRHLGLTQEDVADRIGITTEVYGRLERGGVAPSVYTLRKLCLTLNLSADLALGTAEALGKVTGAPQPPGEVVPASRQTDSKYLRRILRRARRLSQSSLRLLSELTAALPTKPRAKPKPPRV